MGFSGFDNGLLPHHSFAFYEVYPVVPVIYPPFPAKQLNSGRAMIRHLDKVGKYKSAAKEIGSAIQIQRTYSDRNGLGCFNVFDHGFKILDL